MRKVGQFLRSLGMAALAAFLGLACSTPSVATLLQPEDLVPKEGFDFDANAVLDASEDFERIFVTEKQVQRFLEKTPYSGRPSFLATYSSNGVAASAAVLLAASANRINPVVFLVELQAGGRPRPRKRRSTERKCSPPIQQRPRSTIVAPSSPRSRLEGCGLGGISGTSTTRPTRYSNSIVSVPSDRCPRVRRASSSG